MLTPCVGNLTACDPSCPSVAPLLYAAWDAAAVVQGSRLVPGSHAGRQLHSVGEGSSGGSWLGLLPRCVLHGIWLAVNCICEYDATCGSCLSACTKGSVECLRWGPAGRECWSSFQIGVGKVVKWGVDGIHTINTCASVWTSGLRLNQTSVHREHRRKDRGVCTKQRVCGQTCHCSVHPPCDVSIQKRTYYQCTTQLPCLSSSAATSRPGKQCPLEQLCFIHGQADKYP